MTLVTPEAIQKAHQIIENNRYGLERHEVGITILRFLEEELAESRG